MVRYIIMEKLLVLLYSANIELSLLKMIIFLLGVE